MFLAMVKTKRTPPSAASPTSRPSVLGSSAIPAPAPSTRKALNEAARTSTYYAMAPFIDAALSFLLLGEQLTPLFLVATAVMAAGCWLAAKNDC